MADFTPENVAALKQAYVDAGQDQVFRFYDALSDAKKKSLFLQLQQFDPAQIKKRADRALNPPKNDGKPSVVEPLPQSATASIFDSNPDDLNSWYESGLDLIAHGKVAVILMAGGQGTRLGSKAPKGCYDIKLGSGKSLFQIQAERILKIQQLAAEKNKGSGNAVVPWYVMTSGPTRGPTERFFKKEPVDLLTEEENKRRAEGKPYFGLDPKNVAIFEQFVLPCISNEGKILMESKGKVAVAPDGNGGIYKALQQAKISDPVNPGTETTVLKDMERRGIKHIHAYCVDNCLAKVADPIFIGFSAAKNVKIATKVVRKRNAHESVGLILQKNGRPDVVEYSEIDKATAEAQDPNQPGVLKFRAANIVNHYYSIDYLKQTFELEDHVARKKIPCINSETGELVKPEKPNGIKLEQFVFDVFRELQLSEFACLEVKREEEFSPLKNADPERNADGTFTKEPEDGPTTSRRDIKAQGRRWVEAAGATVKNGDVDGGLEISPFTSYGGEGLESFKGQTIEKLTI
ncbi:nucleotide-diphospho-sugar transferase [Xylariaceae sp. FL0662B]|nr:nucleotide-diphospho-sugar transferase [Xylariaceae sp. FL0662B]